MTPLSRIRQRALLSTSAIVAASMPAAGGGGGGGGGTPTPTSPQSSVTVNGSTFTLGGNHEVGQYVDGSWFAQKAVPSVTAISPDSTLATGTFQGGYAFTSARINGVMLGTDLLATIGSTAQTIAHGFDQRVPDPALVTTMQPYSSARNKHPSLTGAINGVETILAAVSISSPNSEGRPLISEMNPLTLVTAIPEIDSFRPWAGDAGKTPYFTLADVDLSFLPSVALPAGATAPLKADLLAKLGMHQTFMNNNLFSRQINASGNQQSYGRDIALTLADALNYLCLSSPTTQDKQDVAVRIIQLGIDVWRATVNGTRWPSLQASFGGGHCWVKGPLVFAAKALAGAANGAAAASIAQYADYAQKPYFAEDFQIIDIDRLQIEVPKAGSPFPLSYTNFMENNVDWNSNPSSISGAGYNWDTRYRQVVAVGLMPMVCALRNMGCAPIWNHQRFFDYCDRWFNMWADLSYASQNSFSDFADRMAKAYWPAYTNAAASVVRYAARDTQVWIEYDKLLDIRTTAKPATSAFAVMVNGSPATVASINIYGKCIAAVLAATLATGDTVTIAYTQPGSNQARTLGGTLLSSFAAQSATNHTGALPAPATIKDLVYNHAAQISGDKAPAAQTVARVVFGMRFMLHSKAQNKTILASQNASSSEARLYIPDAGAVQLRLNMGTGFQGRWNSALSGVPLDTELTMHVIFDMTSNTQAGMWRAMIEWNGGGGRTALAVNSASTPASPTGAYTQDIAAVLNGGLRLLGYNGTADVTQTITNAVDGAIREFYIDWGDGSYSLPANFSDASFGYAADWGGNGEGLFYGTPRRYYAGSLAEWQKGIPNRGDGAANVLTRRVWDAGETLLDYGLS